MANSGQLACLKEGVESWNSWRELHSETPDLSGADLSGDVSTVANLSGANLSEADLHEACLRGADLIGADLSRANLCNANLDGTRLIGAKLNSTYLIGAALAMADLSGASLIGAKLYTANIVATVLTKADLRGADLSETCLRGADLSEADLTKADLSGANLTASKLHSAHLIGANLTKADFSGASLIGADLSGADLSRANLIHTDLKEADLTGCIVYGLSVWDVEVEEAIQSNLVITPKDSPIITVDNLEVAQFIYLLLNNQKIRHVIDTITSKVVLILGRFTPERKIVLDGLRDELRRKNYLPVLFDFEQPSNRDITETVSTLAHMARFVIADITDAKSIPQELMQIVPGLPSVPIQPLLLASQVEYGMFEHFKRFPWVLKPYLYETQEHLLSCLESHVVGPAESKAKEQTGK